jgi:hypothetical protein
MTAGKLASVQVDRTTYILLSYSIVVLISLFSYLKFTTGQEKQKTFKRPGIFIIGSIIGVLNFAVMGWCLRYLLPAACPWSSRYLPCLY